MIAKSSLQVISGLYSFVFVWHYFFGSATLYLGTLFVLLSAVVGSYFKSYLDPETVKFIAHGLFVELLIRTCICLFTTIFNTIFYFGFTATILGYFAVIVLAQDDTLEKLEKESPYGKMITKKIRKCTELYHRYVTPLEISAKIYEKVECYGPQVYEQLSMINTDLNNKWSKIIMDKIDLGIDESVFISQEGCLRNGFIRDDRFRNINNNSDKINMEEIFDDLDDLDTETPDQVVNNEALKTEAPKPELTAAHKKALLKQKIAEKKAARMPGATPVPRSQVTGIPNITFTPNQAIDIMNTPGMGQMMQQMLANETYRNMITTRLEQEGMDPSKINIDEFLTSMNNLKK